MARGQRGSKSGPGPNSKPSKVSSEEDHTKTGGLKNRNKENKQKIVADEDNNKLTEDSHEVKTNAVAEAKPHLKSAPQPTSDQLMIAQIIGGDSKQDDPNQRQKIQKVMDITGNNEDVVATALYDAQWDENRAIELLLEGNENLADWKETGSKKRKNKQKQAAEEAAKDDWDESENLAGQEVREKSRARGPPRLRRGGSQASGGGRNRDQTNTDDIPNEYQPSRGGGRGRGDTSGRGRGSGGRGGRAFQSRQPKPESASSGFSGSIDTWNNPPSAGGGERSGGSHGGSTTSGGRKGGRPPGGKDAFDNAGNWGDDFPAADDWDNEEYTGSLADTKVFTARSGIGAAVKQDRPQGTSDSPLQSTQPPSGAQPQQPTGTNVIGQNRSYSVNGPNVAPTPVSSYSQPIDLSTLLQKPTTQSTLNASPSQQQQSLLQFNQQAENLRSGLSIGSNTSVNKPQANLSSYSAYGTTGPSMDRSFPSTQSSTTFVGQGSAFTSIKPSQPSPGSGSTNGPSSLSTGLSQRTSQASKLPTAPSTMASSAATQPRSRLPPSSKIPTSAVEMPGDSMTQLDVQFGGLDLKFGGSSDSSVIGGFEYSASANSGEDSTNKYLTEKTSKAPSAAPGLYQAKEVNKGLSNSMSGQSAKISDGYPATSVSSVLPKSTSSVTNSASHGFSSAQRSSVDMKSAQQHQGDSIGSYYGSYGQNKPSYHHQSYQPQQQPQNQYSGYGNNSYQNSSTSGYGSQSSYSSSSTPGSGYKMPSGSGNQYQQQQETLSKFDSMTTASSLAHQSVNNATAAVLGLTTTTNALTGKISATTAGKVHGIPNLPPGVASMLPQHYMASIPPTAYYGLQQPAVYSAYGSAGGLEDLAALHRTGLIVGASSNPAVPQPGGLKAASSGYYDPNSQFAANSLAARGNDSNVSSLNNNSASSTTGSGNSAVNTSTDKFGSSGVVSSTDTNSSPIPSLQSTQQQAAAQQAFGLPSNAFAAAQQMPPGYAYFYGGVPNIQAYGAPTPAGSAQGVFPATPMTVPAAGGGSSNSQYQKTFGYNNYDPIGQQGNKDFSSTYSAGNAAKSGNAGNQAQAAAGHQYWGTSQLAGGQIW